MKKIKLAFLYFLWTNLFICILSANEPYKKIIASSIVTSINLYKNILYISTNDGTIEIYDLNNFKKIKVIKLEPIVDNFNNQLMPKVFQTHTIDGKNILLISQISIGGSQISIYNGVKLKNIELENQSSMISKAYFVDENKILIGFLSNEIWLYDLKENRIIWSTTPSISVFSDLIISKDYAFSTTEGGIIYLINLKNGEIAKELSGANFDNIYMLAFAKNIILSAGRDKSCGIYNIKNDTFKRLETKFLSYAVGISEDSKFGAVSFNENNDILIFETNNLNKIDILKGGDALPNKIIFINNKNVIASFDSKNILFWKIGEK